MDLSSLLSLQTTPPLRLCLVSGFDSSPPSSSATNKINCHRGDDTKGRRRSLLPPANSRHILETGEVSTSPPGRRGIEEPFPGETMRRRSRREEMATRLRLGGLVGVGKSNRSSSFPPAIEAEALLGMEEGDICGHHRPPPPSHFFLLPPSHLLHCSPSIPFLVPAPLRLWPQ